MAIRQVVVVLLLMTIAPLAGAQSPDYFVPIEYEGDVWVTANEAGMPNGTENVAGPVAYAQGFGTLDNRYLAAWTPNYVLFLEENLTLPAGTFGPELFDGWRTRIPVPPSWDNRHLTRHFMEMQDDGYLILAGVGGAGNPMPVYQYYEVAGQGAWEQVYDFSPPPGFQVPAGFLPASTFGGTPSSMDYRDRHVAWAGEALTGGMEVRVFYDMTPDLSGVTIEPACAAVQPVLNGTPAAVVTDAACSGPVEDVKYQWVGEPLVPPLSHVLGGQEVDNPSAPDLVGDIENPLTVRFWDFPNPDSGDMERVLVIIDPTHDNGPDPTRPGFKLPDGLVVFYWYDAQTQRWMHIDYQEHDTRDVPRTPDFWPHFDGRYFISDVVRGEGIGQVGNYLMVLEAADAPLNTWVNAHFYTWETSVNDGYPEWPCPEHERRVDDILTGAGAPAVGPQIPGEDSDWCGSMTQNANNPLFPATSLLPGTSPVQPWADLVLKEIDYTNITHLYQSAPVHFVWSGPGAGGASDVMLQSRDFDQSPFQRKPYLQENFYRAGSMHKLAFEIDSANDDVKLVPGSTPPGKGPADDVHEHWVTCSMVDPARASGNLFYAAVLPTLGFFALSREDNTEAPDGLYRDNRDPTVPNPRANDFDVLHSFKFGAETECETGQCDPDEDDDGTWDDPNPCFDTPEPPVDPDNRERRRGTSGSDDDRETTGVDGDDDPASDGEDTQTQTTGTDDPRPAGVFPIDEDGDGVPENDIEGFERDNCENYYNPIGADGQQEECPEAFQVDPTDPEAPKEPVNDVPVNPLRSTPLGTTPWVALAIMMALVLLIFIVAKRRRDDEEE